MINLTKEDYGIKINKKGEIVIVSYVFSRCPCCNEILKYRSKRKRKVRDAGRVIYTVIIRLLICPNCGKSHLELPDFIIPYKRYIAILISKMLGTASSKEEIYEDYPSDITVKRWENWFNFNTFWIELRLKLSASKLQCATDKQLSLPWLSILRSENRSNPSDDEDKEKKDLAQYLKKESWLSNVCAFIYNMGFFFIPYY